MAVSSPRPLLLVAALAALAALAAAPGALRAAATASREPIQLEAQSSELDYGSNQLLFRKVKISQGPMSIAADSAHATGLDFDNSHWVFQGNVRIVMQQGQLAADEADVTFEQKLLQRALITGKPATFEQREAVNGKRVQGRADSIDYDVGKGVIHFLHNAWLSDGQNEISHESLRYIILERRMVADQSDQAGQRVHITITPPPPAVPAPGKP